MLSQEVKAMIPKIQHFLATQPIDKAWLFGSCSRGEEKPDSDVDILVEYDRKGAAISLMTISGIMVSLEDIIHRGVDMVEEGRLLPFAKESADNDKILIYERKSKGQGEA